MGTHNTMQHTQGQDWEEVTLRKTPVQRQQMAAAAGKDIAKPSAGNGKFQQLDHATEAEKLETSAPLELRVRLQQARTAKGLTQAKLAQALNLKPADVQAFEAGKAKQDGACPGRKAHWEASKAGEAGEACSKEREPRRLKRNAAQQQQQQQQQDKRHTPKTQHKQTIQRYDS